MCARICETAKVSGEVKGVYVLVYDEDREVALATLRHEFLDYAVSQAISPFREVANRLLDLVNENAYRKKEQLVESLAQLLGDRDV